MDDHQNTYPYKIFTITIWFKINDYQDSVLMKIVNDEHHETVILDLSYKGVLTFYYK